MGGGRTRPPARASSDRVAQVPSASSSSSAVRDHAPDSVIPHDLQEDLAQQCLGTMRALEHEDQNYGRRPKLFAYGGTADRILTVLDLSPALDLPETSAEVTAMLRQIFAEHGILNRAYVKGRPSNPSGNNPFYLTTDPLTQNQKEIPLVARTMDYVQQKTRLKIARVSLNLHSPGAIQGEHSDYSSVTGELTGRAVVPMAPVGSSRTFVVTDDEGTVLRSYEIDSSRLVALIMRGIVQQHAERPSLFSQCMNSCLIGHRVGDIALSEENIAPQFSGQFFTLRRRNIHKGYPSTLLGKSPHQPLTDPGCTARNEHRPTLQTSVTRIHVSALMPCSCCRHRGTPPASARLP